MPEGPEIRRAADRIGRVLVGNVVEEAKLHLPRIARFGQQLSGHTVSAVDTHGKAMLTRFDNGLTLYSHNQLYGRWYTTRRPQLPMTERQLRVELHTACDSALLYSASDIEVLDDAELAEHRFLSQLGPDLLSPDLTPQVLVEQLRDRRFQGRSLGSLYLDQKFVAGLGNYLRSEILFLAGLHPSRRPGELSLSELRKLARETIRTGKRTYRTGGITVLPSLERELKQAGLSFGRRRHYVFGRAGETCRECSTSVVKISVGSRGLFYCPSCQPR